MNIFVTGTDTGVGKTLVSALLVLKTGYKYWKPIQTGAHPMTDRQWVAERIGYELTEPEIYQLKTPVSPDYAAKVEGVRITAESILARMPKGPLVIEGCGGVMVPLNSSELVLDLIEMMKAKVFLVARGQLGTINHTLLSIDSLKNRKINLEGLIISGDVPDETIRSIKNFSGIEPIWKIPSIDQFTKENLFNLANKLKWEVIWD